METTNKCFFFFKKWFHSIKESMNKNKNESTMKSIFYLSHFSSREEQLIKSLPEEDWEQLITFLQRYQYSLFEKFQKDQNHEKIITPEFLSFFTEMAINEFEKDFSVSPKVSSRKIKGVYYSPWRIIRELTDLLISTDQTQATVLDPSCGTGSFLLYAAERIFQNQKQSRNIQVVNASTILKNFIYGVDKSGPGILVTKLRLLFWLISKIPETEFEVEPSLFSNICNGNSLFGFINEKIIPSSELVNTFSQRIQERGLGSSKNNQLIEALSENWIDAFHKFKTILTDIALKNRENTDYLFVQRDKDFAEIFDRGYIQFLSSLPKKGRNVKSLHNFETDQLRFFHWGLIFPRIVLEGGFDVCLGNPPYGRSVLSVKEKNLLKISYRSCAGSNAKKISLNAVGGFIERSINLLKPEGQLAFILPFSVLRVEEFEGIRDYILENTVINAIHDESAAFQNVTLEMCSLIITKQQKNDYSIKIKPRKGLEHAPQVRNSVFKKFKRFMIYHDSNWQTITNSSKFSQIMGDYGIDHRIVKKDLIQEYSFSKGYTIPFLHSGKCVSRYALNPKFFHWSKPTHPNLRFKEYLENPKLVCTAIGNEFRVAYKPKGMIPGTNVSVMEITNPRYDFFPLMIILNSSLINYVLKRYILNYSHLTVYLHKYYTQLIPIKYPNSYEKEWKIIGAYSSFLTQFSVVKKDLSYDLELKLLRRITEHLVYQLYLPEIFEDIQINICDILDDSLKNVYYEEVIDTLLSHTSSSEEIIKYDDSQLVKTESMILSVLEDLNIKQIHDILTQSEKIRQESDVTKKIYFDVMPKMIRT
jgi:type I restriction-modification system DNA methylase subunit